ncbi:hypothetical protein MNBD_GAMMA22-2131 [hydrothermal vent metagenome]|uniref:STAS domain-containing protein n=1 Tax=hydrothermal vent metagenome TaxID=652676 RepID=A0A3B0ZQV5_9ZZZZ
MSISVLCVTSDHLLIEINVSTTVTIQCEDNVNISGVNLLQQDIKAAISDADEILIQADNVERIDAASLQLFAALFHDSEALGVTVRWGSPSDALIQSVKMLGLANLLKIE